MTSHFKAGDFISYHAYPYRPSMHTSIKYRERSDLEAVVEAETAWNNAFELSLVRKIHHRTGSNDLCDHIEYLFEIVKIKDAP